MQVNSNICLLVFKTQQYIKVKGALSFQINKLHKKNILRN